MKSKSFPKNFLWGVATAAHQVEGNLDNDWTAWENSTSKKRSTHAKRDFQLQSGLTGEFPAEYWEKIEKISKDPKNYISGEACNHRVLYKSDLKLLKQLNSNTFRFSIEWSRVEPMEGEFDQKSIDYYRNYIKELKKLNIEPFVTLWHFTNPIWFQQKGAWKNAENIDYFERFVKKIVEELKEDVKYWCILNEPVNYVGSAYLAGIFPPAQKNFFHAIKAFQNFKMAHKTAYKIIKMIDKNFIVGTSINFSTYYTKSRNPIMKSICNVFDYIYNYNYLNSIIKYSDYIGVQYYTTVYIENVISEILKIGKRVKLDNFEKSDLGWYLNPNGLFELLINLKKFNIPLIITEHGIADSEDKNREKYLKDSLKKVLEAINVGCDVRGYLHWTLMDNYEWDKGYWPRFGLFETDFLTQNRTMRSSAKYFAKVAQTNEI